MPDNAIATIERTLSGATSNILRFRAPAAGTITRVKVWVGTAPAGGTALFDVNINGTSIWNADQTQRITIPDAGTSHERTGLSNAIAKDDLIAVDFDGFTGSATGIGTFVQITIEMATALAVRVKRTAVQSISNNSATIVNWDSEDRDDGGFHDNSTNNTRLTVPTGGEGWYLIIGKAYWANNATATRVAQIRKNGTTMIDSEVKTAVANSALESVSKVSTLAYLVATDYVEMSVYQDSGGNLNLTVATNEGSYFAMQRIG